LPYPLSSRNSRNTIVLLQIAFDKPEHLALLPQLKPFADIIEIGTPVLKRFGIAAIATARELCPDVLVLADTKTVDGGQLEADMVFGAGAAFMTVLSCASRATHETVGKRAEAYGATVIVDTITESGKADLLPAGATFPESFGYVAVHSPTDARLAGNTSTSHIDAVKEMHSRGFRVSLAGGIGPDSLASVIAVEPEIVVVGTAITESANAKEVSQWIRDRLPNPGRGWPWDRK
jgi:3-hexulose-6-phosphate synthase